jgi:hypothetical protein
MHPKNWRSRARGTLRQRQSFWRMLLSQQPKTSNFSTPTVTSQELLSMCGAANDKKQAMCTDQEYYSRCCTKTADQKRAQKGLALPRA